MRNWCRSPEGAGLRADVGRLRAEVRELNEFEGVEWRAEVRGKGGSSARMASRRAEVTLGGAEVEMSWVHGGASALLMCPRPIESTSAP